LWDKIPPNPYKFNSLPVNNNEWDGNHNAMVYRKGQESMRKAGYVAAEPLIKEEFLCAFSLRPF